MSNIKRKSGYTLVETVIYIAMLTIVYFLIISTLLSFKNSYRNILALRLVDNSAIDSMERMSRDIRWSTTVDTNNSILDTTPGALTIVSTSNGISTTTKFYLQNNIIKIDINGVYYGPLTISNASVTSLIFRKMDSGISTAVKVDMMISGTSGQVTKTKSYHTTILMKSI